MSQTRLPRVQRVPRVAAQQRWETIAEKPTQHPIGTVIRKKIGGVLQRGTVTRYDDDREYYWIDYENGDSEEMRHRYVSKYKSYEPNVVRRRSNCIQQQTKSTTNTQLAYAVYDDETGKWWKCAS